MYSLVTQRSLCRQSINSGLMVTSYRMSQMSQMTQVQTMWHPQGPSRVYSTGPAEPKPILEQAKEKMYKVGEKNRSSQSQSH